MSKASISLSVTTVPSVNFLYLFLPLWQQFLNLTISNLYTNDLFKKMKSKCVPPIL